MDAPQDFTTLRKRLAVADGALGLHLKKLDEAGYVDGATELRGRRPRTTYRLTARGKRALAGYLEAMRRLIDAVGGGH
jgi:DNA-binding PadR family transcriptional regulator